MVLECTVIRKKHNDGTNTSNDSASTREEKKLMMRDEIARISFELFLEQGYEKTTMRQIAYRAKILNGSLYNIFHSKDQIFDYIFMKIIEERKKNCIHITQDGKDYFFALMLPYAIQLHVCKEVPKIGELVHEAYSNWSTFNKIVDEDEGWIDYVSFKFGIPFDRDSLRQALISVNGSFSKFVDRYLYSEEGEVNEDTRTLAIQLFTLLNLPLHTIGQLIDRFSELLASPETWESMELWQSR